MTVPDCSYIRVESFVLALLFCCFLFFFQAFFSQLHKLRLNCDDLCIYFDLASNYRPQTTYARDQQS